MFLRLLFESFRRQKRRKALALLAVALGTSVATAMIAVGTGIGDKVSAELRSTGANLQVTPIEDTLDVNLGGVDLKPASQGAFISESDLPRMKGIFWRRNILGFAPFLTDQRTFVKDGQSFQAELIGTYFAQPLSYGNETFTTGVRSVNPWWKVQGGWPPDYAGWPEDEPAEVLTGSKLAAQYGLNAGDLLEIGARKLRVSGIVNTGGGEDLAVLAPLHVVQDITGDQNRVRRVVVSALTKPEDAFARRDPDKLSPADRDRWYCSPYANSIALQIREAIPNVRVEQIRQVEQNQGKVLSQVSGMMMLLTLAALLAAALAVSAAMAATILERRQEVGLMKSLGASNAAVATLFLTEGGLVALAGGAVGFAVGTIMAHRIGQTIFGSAISVHPVVLAVVICTALLVTFLGSAGAVQKALRFDPAVVLRGDA